MLSPMPISFFEASSKTSVSSADPKNQTSKENRRIQMLIGSFSSRPSQKWNQPFGSVKTAPQTGTFGSVSGTANLGIYQSTYVSITRELAFGAFGDGKMAARKRHSHFRLTCLGRIVFALVVFALCAGVFALRMMQYQQEKYLKDHWRTTGDIVPRKTG